MSEKQFKNYRCTWSTVGIIRVIFERFVYWCMKGSNITDNLVLNQLFLRNERKNIIRLSVCCNSPLNLLFLDKRYGCLACLLKKTSPFSVFRTTWEC